MKNPLVSIIVTTRNNHVTLEACLQSICIQTYRDFELIVVDNFSTDDTQSIARTFTDKVFCQGPERCAQRNFGVAKAKGEYVLIIDSDMQLTRNVVGACVAQMQSDPSVKGVVIPEESFGQGFWAKCKRLERSFYVGVDWVEAARFYDKATYVKVGGFNEAMVSGEDWDLSQRVAAEGHLARIDQFILHDEGRLYLGRTLKKKFYYARKFTTYAATKAPTVQAATHNPFAIVVRRFGLFLTQPGRLLRHPLLGIGMLFMKVCEFGYGALGYLFQRGAGVREGS